MITFKKPNVIESHFDIDLSAFRDQWARIFRFSNLKAASL